MRRKSKSFLAILCVITMLTGLLGGFAPSGSEVRASGNTSFKEISFIDFGMKDGTYSWSPLETQVGNFSKDDSTLDGYMFKGDVKFTDSAACWCHYLRIGTDVTSVDGTAQDISTGIQVMPDNNGNLVFKYNSDDSTAISFSGHVYDQFTSIQVGFDYQPDGTVEVSVAAGDAEAQTMTLPNADGLGTNVFMRSSATMAIQSSNSEVVWEDATFKDFGIKDGEYQDPTRTQMGSLDKGGKNLDGYMFKGDVKFTNSSLYWCHFVTIGTSDTEPNGNLETSTGIKITPQEDGTLQFQYCQDTSKVVTFSGYEYGTYINIQVGFDYKPDGTVEVTMKAGDAPAQTMTLPNADGLGINMLVRSDYTTGIKSNKAEVAWEDATFKDFGIKDGEYQDPTRTQMGSLDKGGKNLDGYMFKGDVKFTNSSLYWCHFVTIGTSDTEPNGNLETSTGIKITPQEDGTLQFQYCQDTSKVVTFSGYEYGTYINIQVGFDYKPDGTVEVTMKAGDAVAQTMTLPNSDGLGTNMLVRSDYTTGIKSYIETASTEQETPATTISFRNYGVKEQEYADSLGTRGAILTMQDAPASLDGYKFEGYIKYPSTGVAWTRFVTIGTSATSVDTGSYDTSDGVQIRQDPSTDTLQFMYKDQNSAEQSVSFSNVADGEYVYVSIEFRYQADGSIKAIVAAGEQEAKELVMESGTTLGTNIFVRADVAISVKTCETSTEPEEPAIPISFTNYGITEKEYSDGLGTRGAILTMQDAPSSLDGYKFEGYIKYPSTGVAWTRFVTIGTSATSVNTSSYDTSDGVQIRQDPSADTLQFMYKDQKSAEQSVSFSNVADGEYVYVSIEFRYQADGSIKAIVAAGEQEAKELVMESGTTLGTNIFVRADVAISVKTCETSTEPEPEEPAIPISFTNYGIKEQEYADVLGTRGKILQMQDAPSSLDGYKFEGYIKYPSTGVAWTRFVTIGTSATSVNTSSYDTSDGVQIRHDAGTNTLQFLYKATGGEQSVSFSNINYDEYVYVSIEFRYQTDGSIKAIVTAGEQEAKELVLESGTSLGTNIFVRADQPISVRTLHAIEYVDAKKILEDAGYQRLTIGDFGLYPGKYESASEIYKGEYTDEATLNHTYLDMNLTIDNTTALDTYMRYGGTTWTGINIEKSGNNLKFGEPYGKLGVTVTPDSVGLENLDGVNVKIALDQSGTVYTITIYVNNVLVLDKKDVDLARGDVTDEIGNYLGIYVKDTDGSVTSTNSITVEADATAITKDSASYNLEKGTGDGIGGYLLTGTIESVKRVGDDTELKDNTSYVRDCAIIYPGDYVVQTYSKLKSIRATQNLTLYILGDVNCDGAVDGSDKTALESMVSEQATITATTASQKAADLNNDGKVGEKDVDLMAQIMAASDTEAQRAVVIKKYYPAALTYDFLGGNDVMPIGGMHGPIGALNTSSYFDLLKACGINFVNNSVDVGGGINPLQKTLKLAEAAGIGYLVNDYRLNTKLQPNSSGTLVVNKDAAVLNASQTSTYLGDYGYFDSFLGINVKDEPFYANGTGGDDTDHMEYFVDTAAALNKYTNINGFINLLPEDSNGVGTGIAGSLITSYYNEYWTQYKTAKPQVYSVDDYPFADNKNDTVSSSNVKNYFGSLGKIRKEALADDVPFWFYVQAGGDFEEDSNVTQDRIASEEETYWNVNTALAFGAKGIEYFPLIQPDVMGKVSEDRNGLLNKDGEKTKFYDWAKNINTHIAAIDEVLMKSTSTDIVASSGYAKTQTVGELSCIDGDVTTVKTTSGRLNGVTSSDTTYGALVGCFEYKDTEAFYVVNYDVTAGKSQTVTLTFDQDYYVTTIQQGDTTAKYSNTSSKALTLTIPSGEGALVVLPNPEKQLDCNMTTGISLADLSVQTISSAQIKGTTVNGASYTGILTGEGAFSQWGTYEISYVVDGYTYCREVQLYQLGDANFDGVSDARDLVRIKKQMNNLTGVQKKGGDIDSNGEINTTDVIGLRYAILDKLSDFLNSLL